MRMPKGEWKVGTKDDYYVRTSAWSAPGCHPVGCGLILHIEDGKLTGVEGDKDHPLTQGRLCPRCLALPEVVNHPDRILYPMKRARKDRGKNTWERITWDEALDLIVEKVEETRERYGYEGVHTFGGTGREATFYYPVLSYSVFQSPNVSTVISGDSCYGPRCMITNFILGTGYPEIDHAAYFPDRYDDPRFVLPEYVMVWGKNPIVSNPDGFFGHALIDMMKRGTKLITVDPRITWLASRAEITLQLRPGTDTALLMAMLNVVINEGLYDKEFVEKWCYGLEDLKERVQDMPPAKAAAITWVPEEKIIRAARVFAQAKSASIQWGLATEMSQNAVQTCQCILYLCALTGRIDAPGGISVGPKASLTGKWRYEQIKWVNPELIDKRIGNEEYPVSKSALTNCLADTVLDALEEEDLKIGMVWINSSNVWSCPGAVPERWLAALSRVEFIVAQDIFLTPANMSVADLVLPVSTFAEHDGLVLPHFGRNAPYLGAINKAVEVGEARSDFETVMALGKRLNPDAFPWETVEEFLDYSVYGNGFSFDDLRKMGQFQPDYSYYKYESGKLREDGEVGFDTVTGLFELRSLQFEAWGEDPLPYYQEPTFSPYATPDLAQDYPLVLTTGGRKYTSFHSEHRQVPTLREIDPWPIVQIHPDTAAKNGISDGDWVCIENQYGSCRQKAKLTYAVDPRVVHAEHAWWYPEQDMELPNQGGAFKSQINNLMPHFMTGKLYIGSPYKCLICRVTKVSGLDD
ncbi:MAG: molybdopterin-dependent oxidoreductase [Coriobacteriales bacterium]|nr:molybdopterin-dependent oxidoreductase [Coriobacteriales bacterium]